MFAITEFDEIKSYVKAVRLIKLKVKNCSSVIVIY